MTRGETWPRRKLKTSARLITDRAASSAWKVGLENVESWTGRLISHGGEFEGEGIAFESGDVLFGKLRPYLAKVWVADRCGSAVGDFLVVRPTSDLDPHFLAHHLLSPARIDEITSSAFGSKMPRANWESVRELELEIPEAEHQALVIDFLDRETTEIDAFIADQEELIALLTERRAAAITHAVTKGLDPSAPMNESGLAWLGDLPAQWRLMPFGFAVLYREGPGIGAVDFRDEGVPLIRVAGVRGRFATLAGCNYLDPVAVASRWQRFQIERGDLLVSASASMGTVSEAGGDVVGAIPYTGIIRMKPRGGINRDYLRLFLESSAFMTQIDLLKTGSTIQHYGPEHLRQMYIPVPRERDQKTIAEHLTHQIAELDATIADAREAIALSKERRAALISAAVTGKIDVRGLA